MIAAQRSDGFFNYPRSKLIAIRYLKSQDEGTLPCFFPLPRSDGVAGRVPPSLGLFFSRGATGVKVAEEPRTRSRQAHGRICIRLSVAVYARRSSGGSYQPAVGRGRRPFLIIHRRWQRRNRRDRDWAEMIFARRVKDKEPGGERRWVAAREREREEEAPRTK